MTSSAPEPAPSIDPSPQDLVDARDRGVTHADQDAIALGIRADESPPQPVYDQFTAAEYERALRVAINGGLAESRQRAATEQAGSDLVAGGADATLRAEAELQRRPRLTPAEAALIAGTLAAAPWDSGPVRREALRDLDAKVTAQGGPAPSRLVAEQAVAASGPQSQTLAQVELAADRDRLRFLVTRHQERSDSAARLERIRARIAQLRAANAARPVAPSPAPRARPVVRTTTLQLREDVTTVTGPRIR